MSIETDQLCRYYGETRAVDRVSLALSETVQVVALIGPSGGGKSTLLRLLGGLETPSSGTIRVDGELLPTDESALRSFRQGNGFLFQSFNLFPHLSALENLVLPLVKVHRWEPGEAKDRAHEVVDRFGLTHHLNKYPGQLSGGQQQRVALARAVAHRPSLLFLDEPTSALDPEMKSEVLDLIEELCESGQRIVLSTHEMGFARQSADEVLFLSEGTLLERGSADALFDSAQAPEVRAFLTKVMKW